jgi:hypothetical protein
MAALQDGDMDAHQIEMSYAQLMTQAAYYRRRDPQCALWAAGYGVIQHTALTQVRIHELAVRLAAAGVHGDGVAFYDLLAALDHTAIDHQHQRLHGEVMQQELRVRGKIDLLCDGGVPHPPGKAFDAAFRLGAIGDIRRDFGQLRTLASHDTANQRGQSGQMPGYVAGGLSWVPLCQGIPYGTILAEVVTQRMLLLLCCALNREYTMRQPLK